MTGREERLGRYCRASNDRCADVVQGRKEGGGVMLIKATHLQPIKEPLSSIKANLLKHAARDVQTTVLHTHSDSLFLYLPVQWTVPGPVIPSGMLKDAFGREKGAELPAETSVHGRYIDRPFLFLARPLGLSISL